MPTKYRVTLPTETRRVRDAETGVDLLPGVTANRKESSFYREVSALVPSVYPDSFRSVVTVRFYGAGTTVYCCVWIHTRDARGTIGAGAKAGGYGYHKESAALAAALDRAGVQLESQSEPGERYQPGGLSARGDSAILEVVKAVARAAGAPRARIHKAHA